MADERFPTTTPDEFIAMASHELRTPLTSILGCIHLLRTAGLSQANVDRALEMIERNANAQMQIVEDLLDASRLVAGKLQLKVTATPLIPAIEAAIETIRQAAESKRVEITTNFDGAPEPIDGDPHRLQQIVSILLSNAVKFARAEGRMKISVRPDGDYTQIQVITTGSGIPFDPLPHGLGLILVRQLVELHNGTIQAATDGPDCGAVITLRFPLLAHKAASTK